jgi:DNA-binding CsgD family transcriptional regulator
MISDAEYARLKRDYRRTQDLSLVFGVLGEIVDRATRPGRMPAAFAEGGVWNMNSRANAAQGWIEERLLRRGDVMAAFDFASKPGPFYSSLERSFRHFLMNAVQSTESQNLLTRAISLMREGEVFDEWKFSGQPWWGLASWRERWGAQPPVWNRSDDELLAEAWATGDFAIIRYGPRIGRASPILERGELRRFLEALFARTEAALDSPRLRTTFERRFAAGSALVTVELFDEAATAEDDPLSALEESEIEACAFAALEEMTARQAEVLLRKQQGETLDQIATALAVARGTVDNELTRIGVLIRRLAGELASERVLEKLVDMLSKGLR